MFDTAGWVNTQMSGRLLIRSGTNGKKHPSHNAAMNLKKVIGIELFMNMTLRLKVYGKFPI